VKELRLLFKLAEDEGVVLFSGALKVKDAEMHDITDGHKTTESKGI
jgi:hypothetical protein